MANEAKQREKARRLESKGRWEDALRLYERLLEGGDPEDIDNSLWNHVGDIRLRIGQSDQAVEAYEQALTGYSEAGLTNNAIAICKKILRVSPGRTGVYLRLGRLSASRGFLADARGNFLQYADRMQRLGEIDKSLEALKEFAEISAGDREVRQGLAEQFLAHDRPDEAVEQLRRLLYELEAEGAEAEDLAAIRARILEIDPDASPTPLAPTGGSTEEAAFGSLIDPNDESAGVTLPTLEEEPPPAPGAAGEAADQEAVEEEVTPGLDTIEATPEEGVEAEPPPGVETFAGADEDAPEPEATPGLETFGDADGDAPEPEATPGLETFVGAEDPEVEAERVEGLEGTGRGEEEEIAPDRLEGFEATGVDSEAEDSEGNAGEEAGRAVELPYLDDLSDAPTEGEGGVGPELPPLTDQPEIDLEELELESEVEPEPELEREVEAEPEIQLDPWPDQPEIELEEAGAEAAVEEDPDARPEPATGDPGNELDELELEAAGGPPEAESGVGAPGTELEGLEPEPELSEPEPEEEGEVALPELLSRHPLPQGAADRLVAALRAESVDPGVAEMAERTHRKLAREGRDEEALWVVRALVDRGLGSTALFQKQVEYAFRLERPDALVRAYLDLGAHLQEIGKEGRAAPVYERVLDMDPGNEEARVGLEMVDEGDGPVEEATGYVDFGALILGDEPAEETTRFVVPEEEPSGDEARDFAEMLARFRQKVSTHIATEDSESHYDLGLAFKEMGLLNEAVAQFQVALRGGSDPLSTLEVLGECFAEKNQLAVAARVLERALNIPGVEEAALIGVLYRLARCEEELGNPDRAAGYYQRIVATDMGFRDAARRLERIAVS